MRILSIFVCCLYLATRVARRVTSRIASKYKTHKRVNGVDHRDELTTENPAQLYRISRYFEKKRLIETLENPHLSIDAKKRLVEDRCIKGPNLFAGGLMKDYLFDING